MSEEKEPVGLFLHTEEDPFFFQMTLKAVVQHERDDFRFCSTMHREEFSGLQLSCQGNNEDSSRDDLYAFHARYNESYIDLPKAQSMVKVLTRLGKGLQRISVKYGRIDGFTAYALRVMDVLGMTFLVERSNTGEFQFIYGPQDIQCRLETRIYEWHERKRQKALGAQSA